VVSKIFLFLKEIDYFIQQGCIQLIESDSKDIYNVTKHSISMLFGSDKRIQCFPGFIVMFVTERRYQHFFQSHLKMSECLWIR